nr:hypothetical protein [uncultured Chryseobacterium sp.]
MDKKILKQLKSDYEELEMKPSAGLWSEIEAGIDQAADRTQKPTFAWYKYAAVIILLITVGGLLYLNDDHPSVNHHFTESENTLSGDLKLKEYAKYMISGKNEMKKSSVPEKFTIEKLDAIVQDKDTMIRSEERVVLDDKESTIVDFQKVPAEKIKTSDVRAVTAEHKQLSYINAEDLLLSRELDKTREENYSDQRKFGVFDRNKIKIKGPSSLKILGFTVISDSMETN